MNRGAELKILIVDDFATMRKITNNFLRKLGFVNISEAEDAKKAWTLLHEQEFDLVISDYNMPDMTGGQLLKKIRTEYRKPDLKFIMLSAETDKGILNQAKDMGVDGYILKPFKIDTLREKIENAFGYMMVTVQPKPGSSDN
jgi:two-component system chemotaxis response regulator CheY